MPKLFKRLGEDILAVEDSYTAVEDDQDLPRGDLIVSLARFRREGEYLLDGCRQVGVRLAPDDLPESLANEIGRLHLDRAGVSEISRRPVLQLGADRA